MSECFSIQNKLLERHSVRAVCKNYAEKTRCIETCSAKAASLKKKTDKRFTSYCHFFFFDILMVSSLIVIRKKYQQFKVCMYVPQDSVVCYLFLNFMQTNFQK